MHTGGCGTYLCEKDDGQPCPGVRGLGCARVKVEDEDGVGVDGDRASLGGSWRGARR